MFVNLDQPRTRADIRVGIQICDVHELECSSGRESAPIQLKKEMSQLTSAATNLFLRITPDQIAFGIIWHGAFLVMPSHPAIIMFIPADGIQNKLAVTGSPINQWLAADDVIRSFSHEMRR